MWIRSAVSKWGWAFSSVTRPWVAQRVWPMPVPGASATATAASPGQGTLHGLVDPRADGVCLVLARRLDHDPDQRLGAGGANQHSPATLEARVLLLDCGPDRGMLHRPTERRSVLGSHVDESLRQLVHGVSLLQPAVAQRLEREQRAGDAVA